MATRITTAALGEDLAAFLESGVSIVAASCDAAGRPVVGRALGCEVAGGGTALTLYLAATPNAALLQAVSGTGRIAVVFTQPSNHRSIQVKGEAAVVAPAGAQAQPLLARHVAEFCADLALIGFSEPFTRTFMAHDPGDVVSVSFSPAEIFDQTPGPRAGSPLAS